jgi:hypothetical protein
LSVSLLAVAAVAASLLLTRQRPVKPIAESLAKADLPLVTPLDAIRAAGF